MLRLLVLTSILSVFIVTANAGQVNAAECPDCPASKSAKASDSSKQAELERQARQKRAKLLQQQRQDDRKIAREEAERMEEFRRTHPGSAILHLDVPTGAIVTVGRKPSCECCKCSTTHSTHNRTWQRYRHLLIEGIKPGAEVEVVVDVTLRSDLCNCHCDLTKKQAECGKCVPLSRCCKTVKLRSGDEEYLEFLSKANSPSLVEKVGQESKVRATFTPYEQTSDAPRRLKFTTSSVDNPAESPKP